MKRKILLALSILVLFALAIGAFAYARTSSTTTKAAACCCCKGDSCPMKKKDAAGKETASCCDDCGCCKDGKCTGDSCPMKKMGGDAQNRAGHAEHSDGKGCCCGCCGKDKDEEKKDTV